MPFIPPFGSPPTTKAVTRTAGDSTTYIANTAFVTGAINTAIAGVNPAVAVQAATTAAGNTSGLTYNNGVGGVGATFTGSVNTAITIDGYTFTALGQRLLVKNDTQAPSGAFNGVYYVTQVQTAILPPILTRALDYNMPSDINNTGAIPVVNGTVNATTSWLLTSTVTTVGTDPLTYTQFSYSPLRIIPLTLGGTGADLSAVAKGGLISGTGAATVGLVAVGGDGTVLSADSASAGGLKWIAAGGTGTVTNVSVVTANGVSGSVANPTTTPAITLTLGAILPTSVNGLTITSTTGTLTIAALKTLTANNNITIAGTDGESLILTKGLTVTTNAGTIAFGGASKTLTINKSMTLTAADDTGVYTFPTGTKTLLATDGSAAALTSFPTLNQNTTGTANIAGGTLGAIPYQSGAAATTVLAATATANKILLSGASAAPVWSTPTFPNASATTRKIIVSDGTNWVASTETYAVPGMNLNLMQSDGTNWTSVAVPTWNQNTSGTAAGLSAVLVPASGGTGIANNNASTLTFSGNFATTLTLSGTTTLTLPTTGTLATLAGAETLTNKIVSDVIMGNVFISHSATPRSVTLMASTKFTVYDDLTIGSGVTLTIPSTSSVKVVPLVPTGACVQEVAFVSGLAATGTTVIPWDNTIPQNTEGDQYMSLTITPRSTTNRLVIEIVAQLTTDGAAKMISGAIFQDATANALAAIAEYNAAVNAGIALSLRHEMAAGTTSATTFKFRAGAESAGNTSFNSISSGATQKFGGITVSSIIIREYKQ